MPTARRRLESKDIPQADSLENVRRIVDAVVDGLRTKAEVSERTGINPRHVLYGLHTARVLGFVVEDEHYEQYEGRSVRVIDSFAALLDVSPVTYPAYDATDVDLRSRNVRVQSARVQAALIRARLRGAR